MHTQHLVSFLPLDIFMILRQRQVQTKCWSVNRSAVEFAVQRCMDGWMEFKRKSVISLCIFSISALMKCSYRCLAVQSVQIYMTKFQVDLVNIISVMEPHRHRLVKQSKMYEDVFKIHTLATVIYYLIYSDYWHCSMNFFWQMHNEKNMWVLWYTVIMC